MENDCVFIYYSIIEGEKKQHNQFGLQRLENSLFLLLKSIFQNLK